MKQHYTLLAGALAIGLATSCAGTGTIHGRVELPLTPPSDSAAAAVPLPHPAPPPSVRDAVVYVQEVPEPVERKLARKRGDEPAQMEQFHMRFTPRVLPVTVGDQVRIRNRDRVFHSAFSISPAKHFDAGEYPPGQARLVKFDTLGVARIFCELHAGMEATVFVLPHHEFTQPDATGDYALPPLPQGHYVVCVWHPTLGETRREVDIGKKGSVRLDVRF